MTNDQDYAQARIREKRMSDHERFALVTAVAALFIAITGLLLALEIIPLPAAVFVTVGELLVVLWEAMRWLDVVTYKSWKRTVERSYESWMRRTPFG